MSSDVAAATAGERDGDRPALVSLVSSFVTLLPMENAAVSTLGRPFDTETLVASSPQAARLDEAQIDLGEGPAWNAYRTLHSRTFRAGHTEDKEEWPFLSSSPALMGLESVVAIPLLAGTLPVGAATLSSRTPIDLDAEQLRLAQNLATLAAREIVTQALQEAESGNAVRDPTLSRREVHQATGMILSQMGSTAAEALLALRAHAFVTGMSVRDVAAAVIARTIDFSSNPDVNDRK